MHLSIGIFIHCLLSSVTQRYMNGVLIGVGSEFTNSPTETCPPGEHELESLETANYIPCNSKKIWIESAET
jgi:hypothetical protein